ncbi:MAG: hypothetical protein E4G90_10325 [Gemmatimonadales bacterium]|nr:MAG: hypothetical protein E4G90_10325 [Gemmatimonadales bacterium]
MLQLLLELSFPTTLLLDLFGPCSTVPQVLRHELAFPYLFGYDQVVPVELQTLHCDFLTVQRESERYSALGGREPL